MATRRRPETMGKGEKRSQLVYFGVRVPPALAEQMTAEALQRYHGNVSELIRKGIERELTAPARE